MDLNQAVSVLEKEKELLSQVLELAECQVGLMESGRLEDFEVLLSLRARPMALLSSIETDFGDEMPQVGTRLSPQEFSDLQELNSEIITLANRIVEIDEKSEQFAEEHNHCIPWPF